MEKVVIFDTTLRDGEHAAGCRLGVDKKLQIAKQLAQLGVDIIEAGTPGASHEDLLAVQTIAREIKGPIICAHSSANLTEIDACGRALSHATHSRIHTGIGVSDAHIIGRYRDEKHGASLQDKKTAAIQTAIAVVKRARQYTKDVEFFVEDAVRAEAHFLFKLLEAVIDAGATVVNIPDTAGYAMPHQYGKLISDITTNVPNIEKAIVSVHCHDDLGLAVANTLAGIANGARQIEGTINGIGQRAGNAALEEVIMAIHTRNDIFNVETAINTKEFYRTSRLIEYTMGMVIPPNKAVIGENAFSQPTTIQPLNQLQERASYDIMQPADIGFPDSQVILTAATDRHELIQRITELGFAITKEESEKVYKRFLSLAKQKKTVSDQDVISIMRAHFNRRPESIPREQQAHGKTAKHHSVVTVQLKHIANRMATTPQGGTALDPPLPFDVPTTAGIPLKLLRYELQSGETNIEANGKIMVNIAHDGVKSGNKGVSTHMIEASIKAYVDNLNKLLCLQQ